jgi:predicted small secreted protein
MKITRSVPAVAVACALGVGGCNTAPIGPGADDVDPELLMSVLMNQTVSQTDRFGLPAINTVFIPSDRKDDYNQAAPADDPADFQAFVEGVLTAFEPLSANRPFDAATLASVLQPDVQPLQFAAVPGAPLSGFPHGRGLPDDVIDVELFLIFGENAALNSDGVDQNDVPFLPSFPYLAPPHTP